MVAGRQLEDVKHELTELRERKVNEGVGISEIGAGSQKVQPSSYKVKSLGCSAQHVDIHIYKILICK